MLLSTKYDYVKHARNLLEEKFCFSCEYYQEFSSASNYDRFMCNYRNELKEENPETVSCDHWKKDEMGRRRRTL